MNMKNEHLLKIGQAIDYAAENLPEGYEILISVQRDYATVCIIDPDGDGLGSDDALLSDSIENLVDKAKEMAKEYASRSDEDWMFSELDGD